MPHYNGFGKPASNPELNAFRRQVVELFANQGRYGAAMGEAARFGDADFINTQLSSGIAADVETEDGGTPLMFAASAAEAEVIKILLAAGANVNARDRERGMTPIIRLVAGMSSAKKQLACAELLLKAGADLKIADREGKTAYDWASDRSHAEKLMRLFYAFAAGASGA
jgi:uncharacterized protein